MKINNISPQVYKNNQPNLGKSNVAFGSFVQGVDNFVAKRSALTNLLKHFEFNGFSMSVAALYSVIMGGVILPRFVMAREDNERKEIIFRDTISVATVVFAFKILERAFSNIFSAKSGFALAIKPSGHDSVKNKIWNYVKPVTGMHVLSSGDIASKYSNVDKYRDGLAGFLDFIHNQGGNIKKMFSIHDRANHLLNHLYNGTDQASLVSFKDAKNTDIINSIHQAINSKSPNLQRYLAEVYEIFKAPNNPFVKKAHKMNSACAFISIFFIVPVLLGWTIPKMNEKRTKEREKAKFEAQLNASGIELVKAK